MSSSTRTAKRDVKETSSSTSKLKSALMLASGGAKDGNSTIGGAAQKDGGSNAVAKRE